MNEESRYQAALEQAEEERSFYIHLLIYLVVISGFWIMNTYSDKGNWWAFWPTVGWGIGLSFHAMGTFGKHWVLGDRWKEKRARQLMERKVKSNKH